MAFRESGGATAPMTRFGREVMHRRSAQNCATHLLPHIRHDFRILDVGCGPGSITLDLAKLVPNGHVVGLDINADSLDTARTGTQEQGISNIEFKQGDAQNLSSFESGSFDIVHAHQVLLHLHSPVEVIKEMRRLTKAGGIVSTRDCTRRILSPPDPKLFEHLEKFMQYARNKGSDPDFGENNQVAAHAAGFDWKDIEMSSWGSEESGDVAREAFAKGAKDFMRDALIDAGLASKEQMDKYAVMWEKWGQRPESRMMMLDSALLCWKRE